MGEENLVNASGRTLQAFPGDSFRPETVYGVDFSGAKLAGKNAWIAQLRVLRSPTQRKSANPAPPLKLVDLRPLGRAAGGDERETVYSFLTDSILGSRSALWGMDFPFGLLPDFNTSCFIVHIAVRCIVELICPINAIWLRLR